MPTSGNCKTNPASTNNNRPIMKIIKRILLILLILGTIGILFRGWFYRHLISYKSVGQRTCYTATNQKLIDYINLGAEDLNNPNIEQIIKLGLSMTSSQLKFTAKQNDTDPNRLIISKTAHCVGYASFFATTCNHLFEKYNLANTWNANPQVGQLYFLGTNIHKYFNSSFLKDHDFVTIENKITGELLAVDPSVNDYLYIDFVTYSK